MIRRVRQQTTCVRYCSVSAFSQREKKYSVQQLQLECGHEVETRELRANQRRSVFACSYCAEIITRGVVTTDACATALVMLYHVGLHRDLLPLADLTRRVDMSKMLPFLNSDIPHRDLLEIVARLHGYGTKRGPEHDMLEIEFCQKVNERIALCAQSTKLSDEELASLSKSRNLTDTKQVQQ